MQRAKNKNGKTKPLSPTVAEPRPIEKTGFMRGQFSVPDDFDSMGGEEIERLYNGPL